MQTLNISLPQQLSCQVDKIVENEGYASRSEFFRTILRLYLSLTTKERKEKELKLIPFKKMPLNKIKNELAKTKAYSGKFINSVIKGLEKSSLYADKTT